MGQALSAMDQRKGLLPNLSADESSSLPGLLRLPTEIKLQILYHLVRADPWSFCPHTRLPLLVSCPDFGSSRLFKDESSPIDTQLYPWIDYERRSSFSTLVLAFPRPTACQGANRRTLSVFLVNRRLSKEAIQVFYSENVFYLERYLSGSRIARAGVTDPMLPVTWNAYPRSIVTWSGRSASQ